VLELEDHVQLGARRVGEELRLLYRYARHLPDCQQLLLASSEDLAVQLLEELVDAWPAADVRQRIPVQAALVVWPSGSAGSLEIMLMTSMRNPSIPRSSHQRIIW
jgi:hypothetical protein